MRAVRIHTYGDPSVLTLEELPLPRMESGEVLIRGKIVLQVL